MMDLKPVKSSNIEATNDPNPETKELLIQFKGGGLYAYDDVPTEVHEALLKAESIGGFFHKNIKNKYPTRKLK